MSSGVYYRTFRKIVRLGMKRKTGLQENKVINVMNKYRINGRGK
jgi:hypothetical protein